MKVDLNKSHKVYKNQRLSKTMPRTPKKWNRKEVNFLLEKYPLLTAKEIAVELDRTKESIKNQCRKINLKKGCVYRWKEDKIIKTFFEIKSELGRTPRYNDLKKDYSGMLDAIVREWKTYNRFLTYLNVPVNGKRWTKRECIVEFNKLKKDKSPTQEDLKICPGLWKAILRKWKTYNNFLKSQGLKPNFEVKWNKKTCQHEFLKIVGKINKIPNSNDLRKSNYGLLGGIILNYGKYNTFLKDLGLPLNQQSWTKKECIKKFKKIIKNNNPPTLEELSYKNSRLISAIYRYFEGYNQFLKELGYQPHYGYNDERWEIWEKFVIDTCKKIYRNVLIKPVLKDRSVPDVVILKNNSKIDKIIDAKLNAFCRSIQTDAERYKQHCNKLEFWCMFKYRKLESKNTKILNRHHIRRMLKKKNQLNLIEELNRLEQK
ncbi:MAG: hypothetical protein ABIA37_00765 [Candidatus Woesearchaeota archaeon]